MPTSHGSTIEEWGLTRAPDDEPPFLEIMKRLMGSKLHSGNTLWKHFKIMKGPDEICRYTITDIAYTTTNINLDRLSGSRMKHRDMIVDNCKNAGQDLKRLKLLGLNCITNEDLYAGAEDAFELKGKDFDGEGEIIAELGQIKMLNECAADFGDAKVEKVAVLTKKLASLHFQRGVFMMTFLKH
ncbi:hypothetical protein DL764_006481 [Monosporascus ibericus]|uniref:Uncharacterized protein n=1 Tax=Monosporascus ibericus TaxID=155417 RepID=A0A4Q4T7R4_9PEZI|nr:hypothetical protein DL764_006481 [Monosporascus ibericus]